MKTTGHNQPQPPSPRVFITQKPKANREGWTPDLSPASHYGAIHFIFDTSERASNDPSTAMRIATLRLFSFDSERDYIVWPATGDPACLYATMMVLLSVLRVPKIQFLYWERRIIEGERSKTEGFYTPLTFHVPKELQSNKQGASSNNA